MKAAYLEELSKPLVVANDIEIPDVLEGQVLVKIAFSGVCHSQLMEAKGLRGSDPYIPHMLGHEGTGIVEKIGSGVKKIKVGDRVVVGWIKGQGLNALGAVYKKGNLKINSGSCTTFMEYSVVSENRCVVLPAEIPLDVGVLFGCALPTGAGIILNTIQPKDKTTIAVWGLGGIGLSALLATRLYKCSMVIAIDIESSKLQLAKKFGATHTINAANEDVLKRIKELTDNKGLNYCVESAGQTKTIELAFNSVKRNGGLCVFASHPAFGEHIKLDPFELISGKQIQGSWGGDCQPDRDVQRFAELYSKGYLPLEQMISKPYSLDEINKALSDLDSRLITRALIAINPEIEKGVKIATN